MVGVRTGIYCLPAGMAGIKGLTGLIRQVKDVNVSCLELLVLKIEGWKVGWT